MTGSAPRPWWASDGPAGQGPDPTEDPIEVHRAARRAAMPDDDAPWWTEPPQDLSTPSDDTDAAGAREPTVAAGARDPAGAADQPGERPAAVHRPELCGVCPICTGFRALEELRPDLVAHLSEAARHLAAAFRALAETTATPPSDDGQGDDGSSPRVQHIDLD